MENKLHYIVFIFLITSLTSLLNAKAQIDNTLIKQDKVSKDDAQNQEINSNPYHIDYIKLDKKYYPYIKAQNKYYDNEIIGIIHNVDEGESRSGVFVGIAYGGNVNVGLQGISGNILDSQNTGQTISNAGVFGLRGGYQNYASKIFPPNVLGYQIYLDIVTSFGKNGVFYSGFSADLLWSFFHLKDVISSNLVFGVSVGSTKITGLSKPNIISSYEVGFRLNIGFNIQIIKHHKINIMFHSVHGLKTGFMSFIPLIGYDYVF